MSSAPLVSIIIPAYNAERFIERTLRSALRQTYRNIEIIIIDDGSTDATRARAERVVAGHGRVRMISVPNGGVAKARNLGIQEANGAFVAFLDADDLWHPTKIELQLDSLTLAPNDGAAASYTFYRVIDLDDRVVGQGHLTCDGYAFARHLYARFVGNGSSLVVRRDAALLVGGFDPSWLAQGLDGVEDLDFEMKLTAKYPISAVPHFLVGYRVYLGNRSSNRLRRARGLVATVNKHLSLNPQLPSWARAKALGSCSEHALGLLLGERLIKEAFVEYTRLLRADPPRAVDLGARLVGRRIRKLVLGAKPSDTARGDQPFFYDLSPQSFGDLKTVAPSRRDVENIKRLAKLDQALAQHLGLATSGLDDRPLETALS